MEKPEGFAEVNFTGLEVTAYENQGKTQITAKATGIALANKNLNLVVDGVAEGRDIYSLRSIVRARQRRPPLP